MSAFGLIGLFLYGVVRVGRNLGLGLILGISGLASVTHAETVTIAALGNYLTQGYGLPIDDGFVPQLEAWLQAHGVDVVMINAGVSGDTTAGGLSRVEWTLTPNVDAMIVNLGGNDLLRGLDPSMSRANLDGILRTAHEAGVDLLLVGLDAPNNFGPEYKAAFDAMYPELAQKYGLELYENFFAPLEDSTDLAAARALYMQQDGIHPNAVGVRKIVNGIGPAVLGLIAQ